MSEKVMPKAVRLIKIVSALVDNKDGLTQSQLAKMMGVHRSTIHRDLVDLTQLGPVYEDRNLIMIDEGDGDRPFIAMYGGTNWHAGIFVPDVTHWMPLPELPEVQE